MSSSEDERQEKEDREERAERDARWAKTHTRWDLVPATVREQRRERQRVDILTAYPDDDCQRHRNRPQRLLQEWYHHRQRQVQLPGRR